MALNIKARSELDSADFNAGADKMSRKVKGIGAEATKLGSTFKTQMAGIGSAMVAAFSVGAITSMIKKSIDLGSSLTDMAAQAGITTDQFQALEFASIKAGVDSSKFVQVLSKLAVVMGQAKSGMKTYVDLFDKVGISQNSMADSTPIDVLQRLAPIIASAKRGTQEYGAALELIGTKSGAKFTEVLREMADRGFPAMEDAARSATGFLDNETAVALDNLADKFELLKREMAGGIGGTLIEMLDNFSKTSDVIAAAIAAASNETITFADAMRVVNQQWDQLAKQSKDTVAPTIVQPEDEAAAKELAVLYERIYDLHETALFKRLSLTQQIPEREKELAAERSTEIEALGDKDKKAAAESRIRVLQLQAEIDKLRDTQISKVSKELKESFGREAQREQIAEKEADARKEAQKLTVSDVVSDQLARIGGFMGGQISPQMRISQKQLIVEERMEKAMQESVKLLAAIERQEKAAQYE